MANDITSHQLPTTSSRGYMETKESAPKTIDEYIARFPPEVQEILQKVRQTIRAAAPEAEETISYQMPAFTLKGRGLVYFGAHKKHIGFYPTPSGMEEFQEELAIYGAGKGTAQFPFDQPIPYDLITRIVQFRAKENLAKTAVKGKKN